MRVESEYADLATALLLSMVGYFTTAMFLHLSYERYYWFLLALAGTTAYLLNAEWHRRRAHAPHTVDPVPFDAVSVDGVVGQW